MLRRVGHVFGQVLLRLCTPFYYRPLRHYTLLPIESIVESHNDVVKLKVIVEKFRRGKQYEQKLVGIAVGQVGVSLQ